MRFLRYKSTTAKAMDVLGLSGHLVKKSLRRNAKHIRAVNYHGSTADTAQRFESQLQYFARHFDPVSIDTLAELQAGDRKQPRPGLIISFDDGLLSNYQVCLLYTSPSPRDATLSRMPSSA